MTVAVAAKGEVMLSSSSKLAQEVAEQKQQIQNLMEMVSSLEAQLTAEREANVKRTTWFSENTKRREEWVNKALGNLREDKNALQKEVADHRYLIHSNLKESDYPQALRRWYQSRTG